MSDEQINDPFPAGEHEAALDRLTAIVERVNDEAGRHLNVASLSAAQRAVNPPLVVSDDGTMRMLGSDRVLGAPWVNGKPGQIAAFDADGNRVWIDPPMTATEALARQTHDAGAGLGGKRHNTPAADSPKIKSFDEWFMEKNGASFDELHGGHGAMIGAGMTALHRASRDYMTYVAEFYGLQAWLRRE